MGDNNKRKQQQPGEKVKFNPSKRARKGNDNKWRTPHQVANLNTRTEAGHVIEYGDAGFWVTCQRGLERKAVSEIMRACHQQGEVMYGIKPPVDEEEKATLEAQETDDIEAAVAAELESIKGASSKPKTEYTFLPIRADLDCVFFVKTRSPVDPLELVRRICEDAMTREPRDRVLKHINKLTPVVSMGKSLDKGLEKTARSTLGPVFHLKPEAEAGAGAGGEENGCAAAAGGGGTDEAHEANSPAHTYAIRPSIRSSKLERLEVIDRVAALIGPRHKVNLGSPDKVILVDVFKNFCGMSVVDAAEWDRLRKYNINEIHKLADDKRKEIRRTEAQAKEEEGKETREAQTCTAIDMTRR